GSTYEHDFSYMNPDDDAITYLNSRTRKLLPGVANNAELVEQWAGIRVNTPDRKPIIGQHPHLKNLHIFTGLGSKGLMYGKFLADQYANHLKNGSALYPEISIKRFAYKG